MSAAPDPTPPEAALAEAHGEIVRGSGDNGHDDDGGDLASPSSTPSTTEDKKDEDEEEDGSSDPGCSHEEGELYKLIVSEHGDATEKAADMKRVLEGLKRCRHCHFDLVVCNKYPASQDIWPREFETLLQAAHRLGLGPVVVALLEAGVSRWGICEDRATALGLCALHGYADGVRRLTGNEEMRADLHTAAHWAFQGGYYQEDDYGVEAYDENDEYNQYIIENDRWLDMNIAAASRGQLECVRVLVSEFGADVNARDEKGETLLSHVSSWSDQGELFEAAIHLLLVEKGAVVEARDVKGRTPIFNYAFANDVRALSLLMDTYGASPDAVDEGGWTPLIAACWNLIREDLGPNVYREDGEAAVRLLLRASSPETRCARSPGTGESAVDLLLETSVEGRPAWVDEVIIELLLSGARPEPRNATRALPLLASQGLLRRADWQAREMARRRHPSNHWRREDELIPLAFDARDTREAEERVAAKKARVQELKAELRRRGDEVSDSDDDDDEEEKEEEEDGAASGGAGGTGDE